LGRRGTKGGERKREGGSHIAMKIWRGEGFVASQTIHRVTYSSDGQVARVLLERERKVITPRLMRTEAVLVVRYNSIVLRNLGELAETLGEPSAEGREGGGGRRFVASLAKSARFRKTILYSILSEMKYKQEGLVAGI
jgi:hypothetical protein